MKKGPLFESQVVQWLRDNGFPHAERRVMGGINDRGDVAGIPGVVLELKNCKRVELGPFVDEAALEAVNAGAPVYAAIVKRRGKGDPGDAFAVMPLRVLAALLRDEAS